MAFENIKLDKAQKQTLRELKSRNERANAGGAEVNLAKWQRDLESLSQEAGEIQSALDQCELACEQLGMVFDSQALKRRYPREKLNIAFDLNEDDDERVAIIEYPEADDEHRKLSAPEQAIEIQYYKLNNQADSLRASIIQLRQKISRLEQDMRGLTDREKQELEQLENLSGLEEAVEVIYLLKQGFDEGNMQVPKVTVEQMISRLYYWILRAAGEHEAESETETSLYNDRSWDPDTMQMLYSKRLSWYDEQVSNLKKAMAKVEKLKNSGGSSELQPDLQQIFVDALTIRNRLLQGYREEGEMYDYWTKIKNNYKIKDEVNSLAVVLNELRSSHGDRAMSSDRLDNAFRRLGYGNIDACLRDLKKKMVKERINEAIETHLTLKRI